MVQCTATAKATQERCRRAAMRGGQVCCIHGGKAPQVRAAAARRVAEQQARTAIAKLDIEGVDDPWHALSQVAGEMLAIKDQLRTKVEALTTLRYQTDSEQLRAEVQVYTTLLRDCSQVLATMAKLGLDDRLVRVKEAQATLVIQALERTLHHLGLDPPTQATARRILAAELRQTAPTGPIPREAQSVSGRVLPVSEL